MTALARGVSAEAGQVDDGIFALERRQFSRRRTAQQRADELAVPGEFGDDLHADAMLGLRTAEQLLTIKPRAIGKVRKEVGLQRRKMLGRHRDVGLAPPDGAPRLVVLDDELVLGAAPGVLAGLDDQRAILGEQALAAPDCFLDQRRGAKVFGYVGLRVDGVGADRKLRHFSRLSSVSTAPYA